MTTTNIALVGALGRMGREIGSIVLSDAQYKLVGCVEVAGHPSMGSDYASLLGLPSCGIPVTSDLSAVNLSSSVIINFAHPSSIADFLDGLRGTSTRLVLGSTALTPAVERRIQELAKEIPVVHSPNMSLGVNVLFHLTELLASRLGSDFDIEIVEAHHRHKHDSPSGTARRLGEIAAAARGLTYDQAVRNGRAGMVGERTDTEIGMHAVRGGDIVGDHTVLFAGTGERIEIRHMAHSRATLARGAVKAAGWLADRAPGLYSMRHVLGL